MKFIIKVFAPVLFFIFLLIPKAFPQASLGISFSADIAPPDLPVYAQPPCPYDGYLWMPGYWAYGDEGYYWVPGAWVDPPRAGYLWTPGYWGFNDGIYEFYGGYWGTHIGYYGGINYGYGYGGYGCSGGRWEGNRYYYNTAVVNVNRTVIRNTYYNTSLVYNRGNNNRLSFNGPGGVNSRPTRRENRFSAERHIQPTSSQFSHQLDASHNRNELLSVNRGRPAISTLNRIGGRGYSPAGKPNSGGLARSANYFSNPNKNYGSGRPNQNIISRGNQLQGRGTHSNFARTGGNGNPNSEKPIRNGYPNYGSQNGGSFSQNNRRPQSFGGGNPNVERTFGSNYPNYGRSNGGGFVQNNRRSQNFGGGNPNAERTFGSNYSNTGRSNGGGFTQNNARPQNFGGGYTNSGRSNGGGFNQNNARPQNFGGGYANSGRSNGGGFPQNNARPQNFGGGYANSGRSNGGGFNQNNARPQNFGGGNPNAGRPMGGGSQQFGGERHH